MLGAESTSTYVETVWALAQSSVILLDKVPADLILGNLGCRCLLCGLAGGLRGGIAVVALRVVAVGGRGRLGGCHVDGVCLEGKAQVGGRWAKSEAQGSCVLVRA